MSNTKEDIALEKTDMESIDIKNQLEIEDKGSVVYYIFLCWGIANLMTW